LKQEVVEYRILDEHIKNENALRKARNHKLRDKKENISIKLKNVLRLGRKWEAEARIHIAYSRIIKRELNYLKRDETLGIELLAQATNA
jgi:hypothetical protein